MSLFEKFRESWVRPALFFGNNPISLAGGAITTASGVTMISYWLAELAGHLSDNPYLGIIFFLILPVLFLLGLALIPVGVLIGAESSKRPARFLPRFPASISMTASSVTASTSFSLPPSSISSSSQRPAITARSTWIRLSSAAAPAT